MDKYLIVVLIMLVAGMGIGITRAPPNLFLFYSMLAGAIIVIIYSSLKSRQAANEERRNRRKSKK